MTDKYGGIIISDFLPDWNKIKAKENQTVRWCAELKKLINRPISLDKY